MHREEACSYMLHREESRRASCLVFLFRFSLEHVEGHVWMVASGKSFAIMLNATEVLALLVQKYNSIYMGLQFTRGQCCPQSPVHGHFCFLHSLVRSIPKKKIATRIHTHTLSLSLTHVWEAELWSEITARHFFCIFFIWNHRSSFFYFYFGP